jgi:peptidoglycan LD-endopeptidase CwlK
LYRQLARGSCATPIPFPHLPGDTYPVPHWSANSLRNLSTCDFKLQELAWQVLHGWDCSVLEGHRNETKQRAYFAAGTTKVQYPDSKHNDYPSRAIHLAPYPFKWPEHIQDPKERQKALNRLYMFVGYVLATAKHLGIKVRSGADWDMDGDLMDQTFDDLIHLELVD